MIQEIFYVRTRTPGNSRRHWSKDARDAKEQRRMVRNRLKYACHLPDLPVRVKLTRYSPKLLDKHNTWGALKHVIDGVADALGIDDSDERMNIEQPQQVIAKQHAVLVEIEAL